MAIISSAASSKAISMNAAARYALVALLAAASGLGLSRAAAAQSPVGCSVNPAEVPLRPAKLDGTVVGVVAPKRVEVITAWVEKRAGARISPDYAGLPRILAKVVTTRATFETLAAVVDGHTPQVGDHVGLLSRYLDPRSQCNFIPWTIRGLDAVS